tara:strand:+ start:204 stop:443 length:240 start_codon:yes stop_codon:yes gene_type:complete
MEMLTCINCNHPCHCKGVGLYVNTNQCIGFVGCSCYNCEHDVLILKEEETKMLKKIVNKIKQIISWPYKKAKSWWSNWG